MRSVGIVLLAFILLGARLMPKGPTPAMFQAVPLIDFTPTTPKYLGQFAGNLYDGSNTPPADYAAYAQSIAAGVTPLDSSGNPSPAGRIVFLSAGMSNTRDFWCAAHDSAAIQRCQTTGTGASPASFMGQAASSPAVNHTTLTLLNAAHGSRIAPMWACAYGICGGDVQNEYDRVRDTILAPNGFTEAQVQIVWLLQGQYPNFYFLPDARASAYSLEAALGDGLRALHTRWPNVRLVLLSALNYTGYGGWATVQGTQHGPVEPFSYEWGLSVKWLVAAKITQWRTGVIDGRAGDLSGVPVLWWSTASYLWGSDSQNPPGSVAVSWARTDVQSDGVHPTVSGTQKAAARLLAGWLADAVMAGWFTY